MGVWRHDTPAWEGPRCDVFDPSAPLPQATRLIQRNDGQYHAEWLLWEPDHETADYLCTARPAVWAVSEFPIPPETFVYIDLRVTDLKQLLGVAIAAIASDLSIPMLFYPLEYSDGPEWW